MDNAHIVRNLAPRYWNLTSALPQIFLLIRKMVQAKLSYQCLRLSLNQYVNIISVPPRLYVKIMDDLHALVASMWVHLGVRYWLHIPHQKMGSWHTHGNMGVNHTNVQLSTCQNTSWVYVAKKGSIAKIFVSFICLAAERSSCILTNHSLIPSNDSSLRKNGVILQWHFWHQMRICG